MKSAQSVRTNTDTPNFKQSGIGRGLPLPGIDDRAPGHPHTKDKMLLALGLERGRELSTLENQASGIRGPGGRPGPVLVCDTPQPPLPLSFER